jgi:hypothetical protein
LTLSSLAKLARGTLTPDQFVELLSSMGVDVKIQPLDMKQSYAADEFKALAGAALEPNAKVTLLTAKMPDGNPLLAIMVMPEIGTKGVTPL